MRRPLKYERYLKVRTKRNAGYIHGVALLKLEYCLPKAGAGSPHPRQPKPKLIGSIADPTRVPRVATSSTILSESKGSAAWFSDDFQLS